MLRVLNELHQRWALPTRCALSVGLFILALLIRFLILPIDVGHPYIIFYPFMVACFFLCGIGPGFLMVMLSAAAAHYIFTQPYWEFSFTKHVGISLEAFLISSVFMGYVIFQMQKYAHQARSLLSSTKKSEVFYKRILEDQTEFICRFLPNGIITYVNDSYCRFFGKNRDELIGKKWSPVVLPADLANVEQELSRLTPSNPIIYIDNRVIASDGSVQWCHFINHAFFDEMGGLVETQSVGRNITESKNLTRELAAERMTLNNLINTIADLVWLKDVNGIYLKCNPAFEKFFGAKEAEIIGKTDYDFVSKELADSFRKHDLAAMKQHSPRSNEEKVTYRSDGHTAWLETIKMPMQDEHGDVIGVLGISRDITKRKHLEEQVSHMAYYDLLTQLPNRRLLTDRLNQLLVGKKRSGLYGALLYIDLDNFKPLNDLHGHEAGDVLLVEVGKRIKGCVREMDTIARIGGDEFVALIGQLVGDETKSLAQAQMIAEKVRLALAKPYDITIENGKNAGSTIEHCCTASIGVVVFSGKATDPDVILSMADVAMYEAKEAGRNRIRLNPAVV